MIEARTLIAAAIALRAAGEPYAIATVVRVRGSSYRRPGARMIVTEARRVAGSVSGGCLEGNLVRTAFWRTRGGPALATFDSTDPDDPEAALGCGGVVEILVERGGGADDPLAFAATTIARGRRAAIATVISGPRLGTRWLFDGAHATPFATECARAIATERAAIVARDDGDVLIEPIVPPVTLFVFGTGLDAVPLVDAAARLDWDVRVWAAIPRAELATRFPAATLLGPDLDGARAAIDAADRALAIVMGHDQRRDRAALAMLLASRARFIGVLGPRHRSEELGPLDDPRVHAPVGLDVGAETPDEIAISIVAELLADVRDATTVPLRTRPTIHGERRAR